MNTLKLRLQLPLALAGLFLAMPASGFVAIDWVTVGDPDNGCDMLPQGCFGAVSYIYSISRFEVTNTEYAEFLNAVATTDTNDLYNASMNTSTRGGITQSGSSGSFGYVVKPGMGSKPVNFVSFYDGLRFANWLHNSQPNGAQGNSSTEDGAYTITPGGIAANSITRNARANIFLTSEDEWYKAAYYDAGSMIYFEYPAGTGTQTVCALPGGTANTANCLAVVGTVTDVGAYTGAASPAGTFDQGGNVWEFTEAIINGSNRGLRGGSVGFPENRLAASNRSNSDPTNELSSFGFRVATIPEPATGVLQLTALLSIAGWRRLRAAAPDGDRQPAIVIS